MTFFRFPFARRLIPLGGVFLWLIFLRSLWAQENYEIQVYPSETVAKGATMLELHSNFTLEGERARVNGVLPTRHALHETLELTHGFSDWFETACYCFTSAQPGRGFEWVGTHVRPRVRVPEDWHWPLGVGLSAEVGYQRRLFAEDSWNAELRPIFDKQIDRWYFALNPALEKSLHGANSHRGVSFSPSGKIGFEVTKQIALGVEYYASLGRLTHFDRFSDQQHQLFPVLDLNVWSDWEINLGPGIGLNHSTDHLMFKLILGRKF